jgi:hypothetical protein
LISSAAPKKTYINRQDAKAAKKSDTKNEVGFQNNYEQPEVAFNRCLDIVNSLGVLASWRLGGSMF